MGLAPTCAPFRRLPCPGLACSLLSSSATRLLCGLEKVLALLGASACSEEAQGSLVVAGGARGQLWTPALYRQAATFKHHLSVLGVCPGWLDRVCGERLRTLGDLGDLWLFNTVLGPLWVLPCGNQPLSPCPAWTRALVLLLQKPQGSHCQPEGFFPWAGAGEVSRAPPASLTCLGEGWVNTPGSTAGLE